MNEKVYADGVSVKARTTDYGEMLNVGIHVDKFIAFLRQHRNERGYVNVTLQRRRETSRFGETHSVKLDTFTPKARSSAPVDDHADDMPF